MKTRTLTQSALSLVAAGALLFSASALAMNPTPPPPTDPDPAPGQPSPYQRGPDPSVSFLEARTGPFAVRTRSVSSFTSGFGGGTILSLIHI